MIFAPVDAVRVYRNSAVVRRKATVSLQAGINEVILCGLSGTAEPDSLRLFFSDGVVGKDVQIIPYAQAVDRLPSAEADDRIGVMQNKIQTLKTMEELWISNANFETRGECPCETVESYLNRLPAHIEELRTEQRELNRQIEEWNKKKNKLAEKESFQVVRLVLEAAEACEAACEIEYAERSARWTGTYEIHTAADSDEISVVSRARIMQTTGEDWENVLVSLYTGSPTAQQEIPTLKKLSLQFRPEIPRPTAMPGQAMMMMGSAPAPGMMGPGMAPPPAPMVMEEADEIDADTMTGYALPGRRTVTAGSAGTMADLKTETIPAEMRIVCVPKLDSSAYLAAVIKTENWPLKPSAAKIYLNDNYCGSVNVAPDMTEDVFMLSLGKDERISLSRDMIRSRTEDVLLKGQKRKIAEYAIRVNNNQDKPLAVLVWDQIPVSAEKQITVDHVDADGASIDADTGKLNWSLTVKGKETVEKRLSYTVTYPKDKTLQETLSAAAAGLKACPACGAFAQGRFCPECGNVLD